VLVLSLLLGVLVCFLARRRALRAGRLSPFP
jgi:hypothetical protein